jgi:hypothetical protein
VQARSRLSCQPYGAIVSNFDAEELGEDVPNAALCYSRTVSRDKMEIEETGRRLERDVLVLALSAKL